MWTLSGFADEISHDFEEQCQVIASLGLKFIEFRSAWETNILDLTQEQLDRAKALLDAHGLRVSSIGSPVGKIYIDEDFEPHIARAQHAVDVAKFFGANYIRIFSFFIREGANPDDFRDEVMRRMQVLAQIAEAGGVVMLHENEKDIFGDIPRRVVDVLGTVNSPALRAIIDPANFAQVGFKPNDEAYPLVKPYLAYMHIKDAIADTGEVVVAGAGDGQVRELIRTLKADGYDGFLSLEPHLGKAFAMGGFSGPELWSKAHATFVAMLQDEGIAYA